MCEKLVYEFINLYYEISSIALLVLIWHDDEYDILKKLLNASSMFVFVSFSM